MSEERLAVGEMRESFDTMESSLENDVKSRLETIFESKVRIEESAYEDLYDGTLSVKFSPVGLGGRIETDEKYDGVEINSGGSIQLRIDLGGDYTI